MSSMKQFSEAILERSEREKIEPLHYSGQLEVSNFNSID